MLATLSARAASKQITLHLHLQICKHVGRREKNAIKTTAKYDFVVARRRKLSFSVKLEENVSYMIYTTWPQVPMVFIFTAEQRARLSAVKTASVSSTVEDERKVDKT